MPTVRSAVPSDRAAIRNLLSAAALPVKDLDSSRIDFVVAEVDGAVVGAVGLEAFAPVGLLRSLVVTPDRRGTGFGAALLDAMEQHARGQGVCRLVLLTETAVPFFANQGYVLADRAAMPDVLQTTAGFRLLCPASAACLDKDLRSP